ncbi:hypothetical protein [Streptomyces canus]|uniref:hypothetical protein n=1 Tax=Streptomyces canus TaxID=58343 RepID=UPI003720EC3C
MRQTEHDAPAPILSFAQSLCLDLDAVTAGLTLPWSSGIVEGLAMPVRPNARTQARPSPRLPDLSPSGVARFST